MCIAFAYIIMIVVKVIGSVYLVCKLDLTTNNGYCIKVPVSRHTMGTVEIPEYLILYLSSSSYHGDSNIAPIRSQLPK